MLFSERHQKHKFCPLNETLARQFSACRTYSRPICIFLSSVYSWTNLNEMTEIGSIGSYTLGYCDWQTCFKVSFDWITCRSVLTQAANCFRRFSPIGELLEPVH